MRPELIVVCSILFITSCKRVECKNGRPYIYPKNFDTTEVSRMRIDVYQKGSGFTKLIQSSYPTNMLDLEYDYLVTTTDSIIYRIHTMAYKKSKGKGSITSEPDACVNEFHYSINSTEIITPSSSYPSIDNSTGSPIVIDKRERY